MITRKLTAKQLRFVAEYIVDQNGKQAAIRAGYSSRTAKEQASRLLENALVRAEVNRHLGAILKRSIVSAEEVLRGLLRIAEFDIRTLYNNNNALKPVSEWPEEAGRVLLGLEVDEIWDGDGSQRKVIGETRKVKFESRTPALIALGRHLKLFLDRIEINGNLGLAERVKAARRRSGK